MTGNLWILLAAGGAVVAVFVALSLLADNYNLNNIKSRTVGDGQHGTARWATEQEIRSSYALVPFQVADWRAGKNLPEAQGLVLGSRDSRKGGITALVDKFKALIEANAELENVDVWGKRRLAYMIDKEAEGYYVLFTFSCKADFPAELDRVYKITDGVLRSIIVAKEN